MDSVWFDDDESKGLKSAFNKEKKNLKTWLKNLKQKDQPGKVVVSAPFGFDHVAHIDKDKTFGIEKTPPPSPEKPNPGFASFRTSPNALPRSVSGSEKSFNASMFSRSTSLSTLATNKAQQSPPQQHKSSSSVASMDSLKELEKLQQRKICDRKNDRLIKTPPQRHALDWSSPTAEFFGRQSWIYDDTNSPITERPKSRLTRSSRTFFKERADFILPEVDL